MGSRRRHDKVPRIPIFIETSSSSEPATSDSMDHIDSKALITYLGEHYLVKANELEVIKRQGEGAFGCVESMRLKHHPSVIMAVKRLRFYVTEDERNNINMDVDIIKSFGHHPNIVQFYCALRYEEDIYICMELMDISMDKFYQQAFEIDCRMPEKLLQRMVHDVIIALRFLKFNNIIHRDVKPSNILLDRKVIFKLCDFGISGVLVDSVAKTFNKGCRPYFAPERIQPTGPYDTRSDVWSLGISIIEMTNGFHPYSGTVFQMLMQITRDEVPQLPACEYSYQMEDFVTRCLSKNVDQRPNYSELMKHQWMVNILHSLTNEEHKFVDRIIKLHNEKSSSKPSVKYDENKTIRVTSSNVGIADTSEFNGKRIDKCYACASTPNLLSDKDDSFEFLDTMNF